MSLSAWTLSALVSLPVCDKTEPAELRHERLLVVRDAIAEAAGDSKRVAALLVTTGFFESCFTLRIQQGKCRRNECDAIRLPDGRVIHLARSYWQVHRSWATPEWAGMLGAGPEPTRESALAAARVITRGVRACRTNEGALSYYATGRCKWSGARNRAAFTARLLARTDGSSDST